MIDSQLIIKLKEYFTVTINSIKSLLYLLD